MGRSKETFGKKDVRTKQAKKRKDKEKKRLEKKEAGTDGSFDSMIAWVDENGNICATPPDPAEKQEIDVESIEIGIPKSEFREPKTKIRSGRVSKFEDSKGYGFINDDLSKESFFVHINDCLSEIKAGDKVEFETEKSPKGLKATQVKKV